MMNRTSMINPLDLAELLEKEGYGLDDDTGEVFVPYENDALNNELLITLSSLGKLNVGRNEDWKLCFYLPHWGCYTSMEDYCLEFPQEQQCKCYDL